MPNWFDPEIWPPSALRELNPVVDVEDISMMLTRLDNGVLASYQQCHFTPDYWRNYTVIGDEGRLENFGDGIEGDPATIQVWNRHRSGYRRDADLHRPRPHPSQDDHGGADRALVDEFLRFAAAGGRRTPLRWRPVRRSPPRWPRRPRCARAAPRSTLPRCPRRSSTAAAAPARVAAARRAAPAPRRATCPLLAPSGAVAGPTPVAHRRAGVRSGPEDWGATRHAPGCRARFIRGGTR